MRETGNGVVVNDALSGTEQADEMLLMGMRVSEGIELSRYQRLAGRALTGPESYEQIPELAVRGRKRVEQFFHRLDGQLADNTFVAGENFSMADITAMVVVDFAAWVKLEVPEELGNLRRWHASVSARPSAAA